MIGLLEADDLLAAVALHFHVIRIDERADPRHHFRAADLGMKTVLVERYATLGGVCLNVGCIPSKALLHTALVMDEAEALGAHGITFAKPQFDINKLRDFKSGVVKKLTGGLAGMAKMRNVEVRRNSRRGRRRAQACRTRCRRRPRSCRLAARAQRRAQRASPVRQPLLVQRPRPPPLRRARSRRLARPCRPALILISMTVPARSLGTSMEALSDSTVMSVCSSSITSPSFTLTSMTSIPLKSPISGTLTSMRLINVPYGREGYCLP